MRAESDELLAWWPWGKLGALKDGLSGAPGTAGGATAESDRETEVLRECERPCERLLGAAGAPPPKLKD